MELLFQLYQDEFMVQFLGIKTLKLKYILILTLLNIKMNEIKIQNYHGNCNNIQKKFLDIIPEGYKLFCFIKKNPEYYQYYSIVFYINKVEVDMEDYVFDLENPTDLVDSVGHVEGNIDFYDDKLYIRYLEVNQKYMRFGIGSYLMMAVSNFAKNHVKTISLDDMSDYARTKNSIYVKLGLHYENKHSNEPEMIGKVIGISNRFHNFKRKYANRKRKFFQI